MTTEPDWLTISGVARLRGVTRETVRRAICTDELAARWSYGLGLRLVTRADAMAWRPRAQGETRRRPSHSSPETRTG